MSATTALRSIRSLLFLLGAICFALPAQAAKQLADIACETTTTTGTGTINLAGAASGGYLTFAAAGVTSGNSVPYQIATGSGASRKLENGWGTYTSGSPATLTRVADYSSDGVGAELTLAGTSTVCVGMTATVLNDYQPLDADLTSWASVTRASGFDTFAATPSSANLASLVTDDVFSLSDAELGALAGLTSAADKVPYFTGSGTAALADLSSAMRTFLTTSSSANWASVLTDDAFSMSDAELGALAGLTSAADKFPYFTGAGTAATADLSSAMRTFLTTSSSANWASVLTDDAFSMSDAELGALSGLVSAADKFPYFTGSGTAALADISSAERTFLTTPSSANLQSVLSDEIGTGVLVFLGTPADDSVPVGDSASAVTWRAIPDSDGTTQKLQYDVSTNSFSVGTDDDVPDAADYSNLTGGTGIVNSPTGTIAFSFTDKGADVGLNADECVFTSNATTAGYLVCEGDTADTIETRIAVTDPTASDKVMTIPNADSNPVQPLTCSGTDKVSAISSAGVITCSTDDAGAASLPGDPGANSILFWDDTGNNSEWGPVGSGLDITQGAPTELDLDLTELNTVVFGSGTFTTLTFDAGATDPVFTFGSNTLGITSAATITVGTTTSVAQDDYGSTALTPALQVSGTTAASGAFGVTTFANSATTPASINLGHAAGASIGTFTAVTSGDDLAVINFTGADGTNNEPAASILVEADAATGANDMPGRITFGTTADGAATPTARWIIDSSGTFKPAADASFDIGTTTLGVNNLHFDTGAVINFENGEATLTETDANTMTWAGITGYNLGTSTVTTLGSIELGAASDTTVTRPGAARMQIEGKEVKVAGKQTVTVMAAAMRSNVTSPASCGDVYDSGSNDLTLTVCAFDTGATEERADFDIPMPKSYGGGTLTYQVGWTNTAGLTTETVQWEVGCVFIRDDDTLNAVVGSTVTQSDTWLAQNDLHVTAESSAMTCGGTWATGGTVHFRISRDTSVDNMTGDALLVFVRIFYTDTAQDDT